MLTGVVSAQLEPLMRLSVRDGSDQPQEVEAVVDTGYNGFLTLPASLVASLGLTWLCRQQGRLADGSILTFDVYVAIVDWQGKRRIVEVEAADSYPLLGTLMLEGCELRINVISGGSVTVAGIP